SCAPGRSLSRVVADHGRRQAPCGPSYLVKEHVVGVERGALGKNSPLVPIVTPEVGSTTDRTRWAIASERVVADLGTGSGGRGGRGACDRGCWRASRWIFQSRTCGRSAGGVDIDQVDLERPGARLGEHRREAR